MKRITINLKTGEVHYLKNLVKKGACKVRKVIRAEILLLANKGKQSSEIAMLLDTNRSTVAQIKKRYVESGLDFALDEKPRCGQPRKFSDKDKAVIIATACTVAPKGRKRWTVRLLAQEMKKNLLYKSISRETVRLVLKKTRQNLG